MKLARSWCSIALVVTTMLAAVPPARAVSWVALGVRAGLSISGLDGSGGSSTERGDLTGRKRKVGPGGGIFLTFGASDLISIQPEVLFVSKGTVWRGGSSRDPFGMPLLLGETTHSVNYLEVPLLLRLTPRATGAIRPVITAGPSVAFELSENFKSPGGDSFATDQLKSVDFGAALGLGIERIGIGGIWSLEGRGTFGLTQLAETAGDAKNWNVLVSLGFARSVW